MSMSTVPPAAPNVETREARAGIFRGVAETGARAASGLFDRLGGNRNSGSGDN